MSTINVNYMTQTYGNLFKGYESSSNKNIAETIEKALAVSEDTDSVEGVSGINIIPTEEMTMEEYKQYIYDKISEMSLNPSRMNDTISINISDAGFEAMKSDPEYEKWVLDYIQEDFMVYNPWTSICGGCYCIHYIGASKEEYRGEGWYAGYQNGNGESLYSSKSENSFWERRAENRKRVEKQIAKDREKERIQKKLEERAANEEYVQQKRLLAQDMSWPMKDVTSVPVKSAAPDKALALYEATFTIVGSGDVL